MPPAVAAATAAITLMMMTAPTPARTTTRTRAKGWDEFEDFAVNLMLRCNIALLDSFRLDIDRGRKPQSYNWSGSATQGWEYSGRQATAWLRRAMKFLEFQNLRNLLLGDCDLSDDFHVLRFFHRGSPNQEKVTLWHCKFPGDSEDKEGTRKLDKTSSSGCCCGLDFLRDENVELEIIHKDDDACRSVDELVRDLPNLKGTTDVVPDAAAATEDSMPHSTGVGPRRGTRRRRTSVRISGPEWE
ncbi:uncharacterized protein [Miscanthus floridulus]|uniref:uncharacterized protein n=1 Tax=Miscanthus floridulus TaxID=154761 RepID=UPI003459C247